MNTQDIISIKKDILFNLSKKQIKDAFQSLSKLTVSINNWQITENLHQLETNYKLMLYYLFQGVEDKEREVMYVNLLRSLYELTDDCVDELLKDNSPNIFYEKLRILDYQEKKSICKYKMELKNIIDALSLNSLLEDETKRIEFHNATSVKRERLASDIFNCIFTAPRATDKDYADYLDFLQSLDIPVREKCLFISALTLNLFHRFDSKKAQLLMQLTNLEDMQLRARAFVGLIFILQMYNIRWTFYPELQSQLNMLSENIDFKKSVLRVIIQLIRSRETEQISKKVSEEIIPQMMRFNNLVGKKLNVEDLLSETDFSDKNPEWQKELEDSGLVKKLQEYSNLQMEGADVFLSTFAGLKTFPFFSDMSNWFLPFDTSYSEISDLFVINGNENTLLKKAIVDSGYMCDSDKYSFCLSIRQISANQRSMMMERLGAESEEIKQLQQDAKGLNPTIDEEIISNQYIQNLYRFFKLNPYRNNFYDIFKLKNNFYDKKIISPLISDLESMEKIAHYCFDKNFFQEALDVFNRIADMPNANENIWQKIAYCKQMLGDLDGALQAYLRAEINTPNNSWIIKRIAYIYKSLKQPENALIYYLKATQLTPGNLSVELNIGHCYLEMGDNEKALNSYFKVELLDPKNKKAIRPIAWTAFLLGKYDLSRQYYNMVLLDNPTIHDYLNAGHVEMSDNNITKAIDYYKKAIQHKSQIDDFLSLFDLDKDVLIAHGVNEHLFPCIFDQLKYELES